jgi:hypothetical protein
VHFYTLQLRANVELSISKVENYLESILDEASKSTDDAVSVVFEVCKLMNELQAKQRAFQKYCRFWNLMELLVKEARINKRRLAVNVFGHIHIKELEPLIAGMKIFIL